MSRIITTMQQTEYFETNSDGEQVLSASGDTAVEVQNEGVILSMNVVSNTSDSEAYTYDDTEGYYRISPTDEPQLIDELDALFRVLSRLFGSEQIARNPADSYEIVVKRENVSSDEETGRVSRTNGEFVISPATNHDALITLDDVLDRLAN